MKQRKDDKIVKASEDDFVLNIMRIINRTREREKQKCVRKRKGRRRRR